MYASKSAGTVGWAYDYPSVTGLVEAHSDGVRFNAPGANFRLTGSAAILEELRAEDGQKVTIFGTYGAGGYLVTSWHPGTDAPPSCPDGYEWDGISECRPIADPTTGEQCPDGYVWIAGQCRPIVGGGGSGNGDGDGDSEPTPTTGPSSTVYAAMGAIAGLGLLLASARSGGRAEPPGIEV